MSLHIESFANKIRVMNQTQSKNLTLTAEDARNLHSEIFDLLNRVADLTKAKKEPSQAVSSLELDGGKF